MKDDFVCGREYPIMSDGIYMAQCTSYDLSFVMGRSRKLFLHFKILDEGEHFGKVLFMAFNMPNDGRIRPGSKYYKTYALVNGWRRPSRNSKMSPKLFKGKVYRIKTRKANPPQPNGKDMPDDFKYSVVDSIIEVVTGR
jgi:hypothetical protein